MDSISLFLLQPIDQIRLQCLQMEPKTLSRLMQSSKQIYNVCKDIMSSKKRSHEEKLLKSLFDVYEPERTVLSNTKFENQNFFIERPFGNFRLEEMGPVCLMDNYFNFTGVEKYTSPYRQTYFIDKLDEVTMFNILSELKKQGYTDVSKNIGLGYHGSKYIGNLDDYPWL